MCVCVQVYLLACVYAQRPEEGIRCSLLALPPISLRQSLSLNLDLLRFELGWKPARPSNTPVSRLLQSLGDGSVLRVYCHMGAGI